MPRLHGYKERLNENRFDCAFFDSIITDPDVVEHARHDRYHDMRLFGGTNLGHLQRTNMQTPNMFEYDKTMVMTGWYARACLLHRGAPPTTIETARDLHADLEIAYNELKQASELMKAELIIGCKPMWQAPIADLLRRHDLGLVEEKDIAGAMDRRDEMSTEVLGDLEKKLKLGTDDAMKAMQIVVAGLDIKPNIPAILPIRQGFYVHVTCPAEVHQLLGAFRDRGIRASLWVHLVGVCVRDVA